METAVSSSHLASALAPFGSKPVYIKIGSYIARLTAFIDERTEAIILRHWRAGARKKHEAPAKDGIYKRGSSCRASIFSGKPEPKQHNKLSGQLWRG